jgi:hypothetical protein
LYSGVGKYVEVLLSLWFFLFFYLQQNQNFFWDGLKKLQQQVISV